MISWGLIAVALGSAIVAYCLFINPLPILLVYNFFLKRRVRNPAVLPAHNIDFPWTALLEDNWQTIRAELEAVLAHRDRIPPFQKVDSGQLIVTRDSRWRTFFLRIYGVSVPENCLACPRTSALIDQAPEIVTAMFSILAPGKHIPPHRGPFRGVLRYHLGLKVPSDAANCRIHVGDVDYSWREGEGIVFDDTFRHFVRNDTAEERVVLHIDFLRSLPTELDALNRRMFELARRSRRVRAAARKAAVDLTRGTPRGAPHADSKGESAVASSPPN